MRIERAELAVYNTRARNLLKRWGSIPYFVVTSMPLRDHSLTIWPGRGVAGSNPATPTNTYQRSKHSPAPLAHRFERLVDCGAT